MSPYKHAELSVRKRGGCIEDYLPIHDFMDSTKELCSDNRHRILHTMWGVRRVVLPIFGRTITNSSGKNINVKDLCEQDHILPDYRNRFIPTLGDFVNAMDDRPMDRSTLSTFFRAYRQDKELSALLLSPLSTTGKVISLYITHNSWFLNEIVPQILSRPVRLTDFSISPTELFTRIRFKLWMDNGAAQPPSTSGLQTF